MRSLVKRILQVSVCSLVLPLAGALADSFSTVEAYNAEDGSYLGVLGSATSTLPFNQRILLKVDAADKTDKVRLEPLNTDCGSEWITDEKAPFEFEINPLAADSRCEFQVLGWSKPWNWVGSSVYTIDFNGVGQPRSPEAGAPENFTHLELYDGDTGEYLGDLNSGSATVPFTANLTLRAETDTGTDWVRLTPANADCGSGKKFDATLPYEITLQPASQNSQCQFTLDGIDKIKQGNTSTKTVVASMTGTINFNSGDPGEPLPMRLEFTQGTLDSKPYELGAPGSRDAHGNRIYCTISHFSYDDPIIYPGEPGKAHLHMFWGNTSTDAFSTPESLPFTGGSSCEGGTNYRSGLWIPALFNSQNEAVVPDRTFIYYKRFGSPHMDYNQLQVIPQGLEMLASTATLNYSGQIFTVREQDDGKRVMRLELSFPSCVATDDGTMNGNPILSYKQMPGAAASVVNSHVSYPSGSSSSNAVDCPSTHPYGFATPIVIVLYDEATVGSNPYVASDKMNNAPNMSTLHGDYLFGMNDTVNEQVLQCVKEARSCRFNTSGDNLDERSFDSEGNRLYQYNILLPEVDRTPFGTDLPPMQMGL